MHFFLFEENKQDDVGIIEKHIVSNSRAHKIYGFLKIDQLKSLSPIISSMDSHTNRMAKYTTNLTNVSNSKKTISRYKTLIHFHLLNSSITLNTVLDIG